MGFHDHAHGDLSSHDSLNNNSIADQLERLLANPHKLRSWLFDAHPRDPSTSTDPVTTIRVSLSTDGHTRYPTDAEERQFPQAIIQPFALTSTLGSALHGTANISHGEIIIGDAAQWHRAIADYDWFGRDGDVYLGPSRGIQVQFAKVAQVKTRGRRLDSTTIAIVIDDYSYIFDRLLQTNYYTGAGGLEGPGTLTDKPKPILIGKVDQIEPTQVDETNRIYQFHDGSLGAANAVAGVDDEMVALSFDADFADIASATPGVDEFSTSLAQGVIKIGSNHPNGVITMHGVEGIVSSTYGYVDSISPIIKTLAVDFAGLTDPVDLDPLAFTALDTHTATMGWYFGAPKLTIRAAMNIFHRSAMSFAYLQPNKILTCGRITDPDAATADFTLDASKDQIKLQPWNWTPYEIPVGRVLIGFRHYCKTLNASEVDSTISANELLDIGASYRWSRDALLGNDLAQNDDFKTVTIETALYNRADAALLATEQLDMRSVKRDVGTVESYGGLLSRKIGQAVDLTDDRLGSSPKQFVVLGVRNVAAASGVDDKVELELYG
jgi:hypothetical protein